MSVSIVLATAGGRIGEIAGSRSRYAVSAGASATREPKDLPKLRV
jgi:hypothetical protein